MLQRFWPFALLTAFLIIANCKNDTTQPTSDPAGKSASGKSLEYKCTLSRESLLGFKPGDTIAQVAKKLKFELTAEKIKDGDLLIDTYVYHAANGESVRIFPVKKGDVEKALRVEYTGGLCQTDKEVGVSSTVGALLKAYPDLVVHGSATDGRTVAKGGHWFFLLGTKINTPDVDIKTLNQDIRVTAIVLQ
jgi:hypothetical protein